MLAGRCSRLHVQIFRPLNILAQKEVSYLLGTVCAVQICTVHTLHIRICMCKRHEVERMSDGEWIRGWIRELKHLPFRADTRLRSARLRKQPSLAPKSEYKTEQVQKKRKQCGANMAS
jgi:hypothetical protein